MNSNNDEILFNKELFIKQIDVNKQISTTGSRAIVLLILLMTGPKSAEELQKYFIASGVVEKKYSIDTIRIDINTLKAIGCKITKATKKTDHKYGLISQPFELNLTQKEVSTLKSVYRKLIKTVSPSKLVKYHRIFEKIARINSDKAISEQILGISILKSTNIDLLEELVADEKKYNKIQIKYSLSGADEDVEYDISPERFEVRSGRLYLFGFNHTLGARSFLPVSKIKSIVCKLFDRTISYGLDTIVKFRLRNYNSHTLEENEIMLEENSDFALIEGHYYNEFIAIQRMLFFAGDCTVLEPENIRNDIIQKLKEMRSIYE